MIELKRTYIQESSTSRPLTIGMLTTYNQPCGLATYAGYLAGGLKTLGITPFIFAEKTAEAVSSDSMRISRCWTRHPQGGGEVVQKVLEKGVDILHVNHGGVFPVNGWLPSVLQQLKKAGVGIVITFHSTEADHPEYKLLCEIADRVTVHFPQNSLQLLAMGAGFENIDVVPHGISSVNQTDLRESKASLGLDPGRIYITTFGFVEPHKGILEIIEAVHELRSEHSINLFIAGTAHPQNPKSGQYLELLKRKVHDLRLHEQIAFADGYLFDEAVEKYLRASDAIVLNHCTNRFEASGAAAVALASGRPLITSTAPAFDYPLPITLKASELRPLSACIRALLNSSQLQEVLLNNLLEYEQKAHWTQIALRFIEFYTSIRPSVPQDGRRVSKFRRLTRPLETS